MSTQRPAQPSIANQTSATFSATSRVVAFGEILWDLLPTGKKLGGAPVNFLYHAQTLGADVRPLTRIGSDALGDEIRERLDALVLSPQFLQISPDAPTGTVAVSLDAAGTPTYRIVENVAWDEIAVDAETADALVRFLTEENAASAFYFGSLALRSETNKRSLTQILERLPRSVLRVCDLNLRAPFYSRAVVESTLNAADVFKLNDAEAVELDALFADLEAPTLGRFADDAGSLTAPDSPEVAAALADWAARWRRRFNLRTLILTCGGAGAWIFDETGSAFASAAPVERIADTVGAGDSFAAVCVVGLLSGRSVAEIVAAASRRASFVCSQEGGTPTIPPEAADPFAAV